MTANATDKKKKTGFFKKRTFIFLVGLALGMGVVAAAYLTSVYFSTDESCMMCHVHPHVEDSWKISTHVNNGSGVKVHCVDCHLPPKNDTWDHYTAKLQLGLKDAWGYFTKDSADFDWDLKSELEHAVKYIPNQSCKECHQNLFPQGITPDGITAHLYYDENEKKLDLQCISCHLDVGHHNPNYTHGKLTGIPGQDGGAVVDPSLYFKEATVVSSFENYTEEVPGTAVSFNMIAIPGGTFAMGSTTKEDFHQPDEAPVRNVTVSPFFMAEVEVTWDQFWAFYGQTMSEGRTLPADVYANNSDPDVDAISGPTPPFGFPDQGWGSGDRPAITMTHYAAETFCQWLSMQTGKKYRLPTEAEWEYAARGGTKSPYFFEGQPKNFSDQGFMRKFIAAKTEPISEYVIYGANSKNRTQEPSAVKANPFGLKNMLGNVMEYCADKYSPEAYAKTAESVTDPLVTEGEEWVVRGGNYTSDAADVRVAARDYTKHDQWLKTDPQQPKSIWWYSDIRGIGFRVVCEPGSVGL
ncbi:SUMF1/EgtB/PvdO family nonheme iron enzyme [Parabacteroides sp. PF5-6]|uniref:SUMF1/EgtB/PvdO family nonheme iron enzyme n=1 Tax=Parabacteroides sp. PF5-6 TaxID=1742403 RepID=UPI0024053755|nr:SUMF1/EgtB/PvdO family nonheme iron enzyme [Parabacteroides sp. PF5-6]MDF9830100.1 sulfatase modifying factor 1 [Parabacteroides sp. PF5-6]